MRDVLTVRAISLRVRHALLPRPRVTIYQPGTLAMALQIYLVRRYVFRPRPILKGYTSAVGNQMGALSCLLSVTSEQRERERGDETSAAGGCTCACSFHEV